MERDGVTDASAALPAERRSSDRSVSVSVELAYPALSAGTGGRWRGKLRIRTNATITGTPDTGIHSVDGAGLG